MRKIGLTGGIASGKSTVARRLASWGAVHLDADHFARAAVDQRTTVGRTTLAEIADAFGPDMLTASGSLDRERLGARIFADVSARSALNDIMHPVIRSISDAAIAEIEAQRPDALVVVEAALVAEASSRLPFDVVMTTSLPVEAQIERLRNLRGMTLREARDRVAAQGSDADRRRIADIVLDTGRPWPETERELVDVWVMLRAMARET